MQPFLRDDLWARPYVNRAEQYTQTSEKDFVLRPHSRITFLGSALVATAQTICFIVITPIALVANILTTIPSVVISFKFADRVSAYYWDSFSKLRGSLTIMVISTLSALTSTELSRATGAWLSKRSAGDWNQFKTQDLRHFAEQIDRTRELRLTQWKGYEHEMFTLGSHYTYSKADGTRYSSSLGYDAMLNEAKVRAIALINEADARINAAATPAQKFECATEAMNRIGSYISKKQSKLGQLPVSYLEFTDYKVSKAQRLKGRALSFLDEQAAMKRNLEYRRYPDKFNAEKYDQKVADYRSNLGKRFDASVEDLRKKQKSVKDAWQNKVGPAQKEFEAKEANILSHERWIKWGKPFLKDETLNMYSLKLIWWKWNWGRALSSARDKVIADMRGGEFSRFERQQLRMDRFFGKQVRGNGNILGKIDQAATASWERRLFRNVISPFLKVGPEGVYKCFEGIFDPAIAS